MDINDKIESLIDNLFEDKYINAKKLSKKDILLWVVRNLWRFSDIYEYECHKDDIMNELYEKYFDRYGNIPDSLIESMVSTYQEKLADYGAENGWQYILDDVINDYKEEIEKVEKEEIGEEDYEY